MIKKAFTLAEVLITLAIIGVVAALTIPTVLANYERQQTGVRLKKAYNTLNQAINQSSIVNGNPITWDYTLDETTFVERYFLPYLKVSKNCGTKNNFNCFSKFYTMNGRLTGPSKFYTLMLSDGTSIKFTSQSTNSTAYHIYVDINGPKKPNLVGKDIFSFFVGSVWNAGDGNYYGARSLKFINYFYPDGYGIAFVDVSPYPGLFSPSNMRGCNKTPRNAGFQCTAVIMQNNWKVPDKKEYKKLCPTCLESDYPW